MKRLAILVGILAAAAAAVPAQTSALSALPTAEAKRPLQTLPYTPSLVACRWATHVIWTTVGLSISCLLLYVWLIVAMVRRPADQIAATKS